MQPSVLERLITDISRAMRRHGDLLVSLGKSTFCLFVISLLLEVFLFNCNYWTSLSNEEIDITDRLSLAQNPDGSYYLTEVNHVMEFSGLNTEIENIRIDFSSAQSAKNVQLKIQFTDDAHLTYFEDTEYSTGVPLKNVPTNDDQCEYIKLNTVGVTDDLRIEVVGSNQRYPITVDGVYLNSIYFFEFKFARFFTAFLVLLLCFMFRPGSRIYSIYIVSHPRVSKACVSAFLALEIALMTGFLFFGSNLVGVATSNYNWGSWDGHSIVNTFEVGGNNAQQYSYLAQAFADGQLYLEEEPPEWLVNIDNPYDKGARAEMQKATGESYLWDVVYYDGHYYVYFGVVPVLLFYLPFYLLTKSAFPTAIGVLVSAILFLLGATMLLDRFARYHFKRVSLGLYLLLQLPLVCCSGLLYLIKHPTFYSLPIALALAFSMWGLYFWLRGRSSKHPIPCYLFGSLCMALVAGCRPQLLILSFLAFPLFWRHYISERKILTKWGMLEFVALITPYFIIGAGLMWYNAARFGSPFDFGSNYNLTTNDMTQRGFDPGRLLPAVFAYFFQLPSTVGVFPYLEACPFETTYMGQTIKEATFGGLFACVPILWTLVLAGRAIKLRIKMRKNRTVAGVICVLIGGGVVVALADAQMAGILQRYFADFSVMFLLAAALVIFIFNENISHLGNSFYLVIRVIPLLVALSLVYQLCLCFVPETGWFSNVYPWAYQRIVNTFQFWT